jgi:hypothetical protein
MAKTVCKILGVVFILVGLIGFVSPGFLGTHLSLTHNLVHLISGAVALYFGFAATLSAARLFCIIFGVVYALLGICGFLLGTAPTACSRRSRPRPAPRHDGSRRTHPARRRLPRGGFLTRADMTAGD